MTDIYLCNGCQQQILSRELSNASFAVTYPSMTPEVPTARHADKFFAFTTVSQAESELMSKQTIARVRRILKKAPWCIVLYCTGLCKDCQKRRRLFAENQTKVFKQLESTKAFTLEFKRGVETERARWLKLLEDEAKSLQGTSWETYMAVMDIVHVERAKAKAKRSK